MLSNAVISHNPIQVSNANTPITVNANVALTYPWALGSTNCFYKINDASTWTNLSMNGVTSFNVSIPSQPNGTVISYYLSLGAREDELIEAGKLKTKMPSSVVIGSLSGLGMWTFFIVIGIIAVIMGEAFSSSGLISDIAKLVALILIFVGVVMLLGVTTHLLGFVQRFVDKYSTTEDDDTFTPRRNMYLYGIGYAAASIDCTAAAVLPFVIFLSTLGGSATVIGIGGLMLGLLVLMICVTTMVGLGRQVMINFLRRATGMIKLVGPWMMIMAGVSLTIYLNNPEIVGKLFG